MELHKRLCRCVVCHHPWHLRNGQYARAFVIMPARFCARVSAGYRGWRPFDVGHNVWHKPSANQLSLDKGERG